MSIQRFLGQGAGSVNALPVLFIERNRYMIPDIENIKGKLVEFHGTPEADTTKLAALYIKDMQGKHETLTYYCDIRNELSKTIEDASFYEKVWVTQFLSRALTEKAVMYAAQYVDLIVIDDITYIDGDLWKFLSSMRSIARDTKTAVLLLNQKRCIIDSRTQEFVEMPYRFNAVKQYCSYAVDADTNECLPLDGKEPEYDDFIRFLLKAE